MSFAFIKYLHPPFIFKNVYSTFRLALSLAQLKRNSVVFKRYCKVLLWVLKITILKADSGDQN